MSSPLHVCRTGILSLFCTSTDTDQDSDRQPSPGDDVSWLCWFCQCSFLSPPACTHHMSVRHPQRDRLVPPGDFGELDHCPAGAERHQAAADEALAELSTSNNAAIDRAGGELPPPVAASFCDEAFDGEQPLLGGLGVVSLPSDAHSLRSLNVVRPRNVLQTSTAARFRAY